MDQGVSSSVTPYNGGPKPPHIRPVVEKVADVLPNASVVTLPGAGHIPHITHPNAYVEAIMAFIRKNPS